MNVIMVAQADPWAGISIGRHLAAFSPMIALVAAMLVVVLCPVLIGRTSRVIGTVAALGVGVALGLTVSLARQGMVAPLSGLSTEPALGLLVADNLAIGFQLILYVFLAAILWLWWLGSAEGERNAPEFVILLLGSAFGMALMVSTSNLLMAIIAIETASLPSYAIVGFDKRDRRGAEASLKYMVFGAVSAAIMLYGASLLYGLVGSLGFTDVAQYAAKNLVAGEQRLVLSIALLSFLAGVAFKISAVPFHFWCPDAFEGARAEVTTWLSVASKAAGLILLMRMVLTLCQAVDRPTAMSLLAPAAWTIGMIAALTCTVGNFCAYRQQSVKRILAYSSIAHAGYMMMAAAVFLHPTATSYVSGATALLVYIVIYMFMNLGAFGVTALVQWSTGSDRIESFTGLIRRAPQLAIPMVICLVSLVGIPPFAGFIGKWWVLFALGGMQSSAGPIGGSLGALGWVLIIVAVVNTLISLYFYMRIVVQMTLRDDRQVTLPLNPGGALLVNVCAAALLVLFLFPAPVKDTAEQFTRRLYHASAPVPAKSVALAE